MGSGLGDGKPRRLGSVFDCAFVPPLSISLAVQFWPHQKDTPYVQSPISSNDFKVPCKHLTCMQSYMCARRLYPQNWTVYMYRKRKSQTVHARVHTNMCMCVYMDIDIYIYVHEHAHIHTVRIHIPTVSM